MNAGMGRLARALALLLATLATLPAWAGQHPGQMMDTPVENENFDEANFTFWGNGKEQKVNGSPNRLMWTKSTVPQPHWYGFGGGNAAGNVCHLRVPFKQPVPVGSVIIQGGGRVSVLKPDAQYPGRLNDDADWLPAERLDDKGKVVKGEVAGNEFAVWVLPAGTVTRAIRFTHQSGAKDSNGDSGMAAVAVAKERLQNASPYGAVATRSNQIHAGKMTNMHLDHWGSWENIPTSGDPARPVVSAKDYEPIVLFWPEATPLDCLIGLFSGFGSLEIDEYAGPVARHPREAREEDWKLIRKVDDVEVGYPTGLWPNFMPFGKTVTTRALRIRLTSVTKTGHGHMMDKMAGGKRVFADEFLACRYLSDKEKLAAPAFLAKARAAIHPPIPIKFTLPEEGYVTLVIEKADGTRVRNLVSETKFPKGNNTAWWDGTDDLGRDLNACEHGLYQIPVKPVAPGDYRVRGLWRKDVNLIYEFSVYSPGNVPWDTNDHTGAWLANHSAPSAAAFVPAEISPLKDAPAMFLGCLVTEGPDGMCWTDMDMKKMGGMKWIGGAWLAAPHLASDFGPDRDPETSVYTAAVFETDGNNKGSEVRVNRIRRNSQVEQVGRFRLGENLPGNRDWHLAQTAVWNRLLVCAMPMENFVWVLNAANGREVQKIDVKEPRGAAFDREGNLYVISEKKVWNYGKADKENKFAAKPAAVVKSGLDDPVKLAVDPQGQFFVSDRGSQHNVKVFNKAGKAVRAIGKPGKPGAGKYDELKMVNPAGLAVDDKGRLWVTEDNTLPKRVSMWDAKTGKFLKAVYGSPKYGFGGAIDRKDKNRFYYDEDGTMEFAIDWKTGKSRLVSVLYRPGEGVMKLPGGYSTAPQYALYHGDKRYMTNCYNNSPVDGSGSAFVFIERKGVMEAVAGMGSAAEWKVLKEPAFQQCWPANPGWGFFIWSDRNGNAQVEPDEVKIHPGNEWDVRGITVMDDFTFCAAKLNGHARRFPVKWEGDIPTYDMATAVTLDKTSGPATSGGCQLLCDASDESVTTQGAGDFHQYSLCGMKGGKAVWSYPSLWPGLHASHNCPYPTFPGELLGTTRLMGGFFNAKGAKVGPLWAVNGNMGNSYVFTRDGLFVATLFRDKRLAPAWNMQKETRGENFNDLTQQEENFWPTIMSTPEGQPYMVTHCAVVRIDGLDSLRPLPATPLKITAADLQKAQDFRLKLEAQRRKEKGSDTMTVKIVGSGAINIDGKFDEWKNVAQVEIDQRGTAAYFDSAAQAYNVTGKMATDGKFLYACWDSNDKNLLQNSGEMPVALFKTGGCLDIMIATNPAADANRRNPIAGDTRLLVTKVKDQVKAYIYRQVVPGTPADKKVPFSSPWRTINFDEARDVSGEVRLADDGQGRFEVSVPLKLLGLQPKEGVRFKGDIGILRGNGRATTARVYWANKATMITEDVPSEAELLPGFWGNVVFKK